MTPYPKIQTMFKRDMEAGGKLLRGQWTMPEFRYLADNAWEFTEKVDGTNIRICIDLLGRAIFKGRTDAAQIPAQLSCRLIELFHAEEKRARLQNMFPEGGACLYGEGYGANIQKGGGNYRKDQDFVLFDVKVGDWWLKRSDVEEVAQLLDLDVVPVIGHGTLYEAASWAKSGIHSQWGPFLAEGIIAKTPLGLMTRGGHRLITKIKTCDF